MNATELLANTLSHVKTTREDAERKLATASQENFPQYMLMLSTVLVDEHIPWHIRQPAGIALKNALTAPRESIQQTILTNRWLALPIETKTKIKQDALLTLGSPHRTSAAQVVAAIATVELPQGQWPDLIEILLGFVNNQGNTHLRTSTLETIGFICEAIEPPILSPRSNEILTAVIHGARKEEPSPDIQLAAIRALLNSLAFVRENFEREGERNYIMQVVCEATQNPSVNVQAVAFECLVRIMSLYYEKMGLYMEQALFGLTVVGMKHQDEQVALQAIEFWSTVCEEELVLAEDAQTAQDYGEAPEQESQFFAKIALPEIVPVLLQLLTQQEEDAGEDDKVPVAAAVCLSLLADTVQDPIVPAVIPFIEAHIKSDDWHKREAAVMTFGSILKGPDPDVLTPLVNQALPLLIDMMLDENPHVKDTTSWTLGRICDHLTIKPDVHLHPLISALVNGLQGGGTPHIVANCCWALKNLAEQPYIDEEGESQSGYLSPYYEGVVQALLQVADSTRNESHFRTSAYEAIASWLSYATPDTIAVVQNTLLTVLQRMEQLLMPNQIVESSNWNELQSNLCGVLIAAIHKLNEGIQPLADRIMTLVIQLIQSAGRTSTVLEDAFFVVGALASALDARFSIYMTAFLQYLYPALKQHEDTALCQAAVGLIGDISRALGGQSEQYSAPFMTVLLENLQSDILNREVKISILSCFGDIALAIGPAFAPYLETTMGVLRQAGAVEPNPLDLELVDYVTVLRQGILEAYTSIVTGLKKTPKVSLLLPHVQNILEFVNRCLVDEDRTDPLLGTIYGLIGDLADCFPDGQIKQFLLANWIAAELRTRHRMPEETKRTLRWAREAVKIATQ